MNTNTPQCNIKIPHSHLIAGQTFPCETGEQSVQTIQETPLFNMPQSTRNV